MEIAHAFQFCHMRTRLNFQQCTAIAVIKAWQYSIFNIQIRHFHKLTDEMPKTQVSIMICLYCIILETLLQDLVEVVVGVVSLPIKAQ